MSATDDWAGVRQNARLLIALWAARRGAPARVQFWIAGEKNRPAPSPAAAAGTDETGGDDQ